ncbi:amidophosphoribosyltransferase, partial [Bacillus cereus]
MHCLLCEEDISYAISWCNFFVKAHKKYI